MNVVCICMSPALDATVMLKAWPKDGDVVKDVAEVVNAGGKALNVARWIGIRRASLVPSSADVTVACGGLLGADDATPFERELRRYGIVDRFVRVPGSTRRNEMIVTPEGSFKLNRKAFPGLVLAEGTFDIEALGIGPGDVAVLSGSLPPCCPATFYADCTRALKARGATVVLDASGAPLCAAVFGADADTRPDVIKPNAEECEPLVGFVPRTPEDFRRATDLLRTQVPHVIVSDGGAGCWFDGVFTPAPSVDVLDTTAAGDTLLAEWCWRTYAVPDPDAARWAVAAGSAACTMPGGDPPALDLVEMLKGTNLK